MPSQSSMMPADVDMHRTSGNTEEGTINLGASRRKYLGFEGYVGVLCEEGKQSSNEGGRVQKAPQVVWGPVEIMWGWSVAFTGSGESLSYKQCGGVGMELFRE